MKEEPLGELHPIPLPRTESSSVKKLTSIVIEREKYSAPPDSVDEILQAFKEVDCPNVMKEQIKCVIHILLVHYLFIKGDHMIKVFQFACIGYLMYCHLSVSHVLLPVCIPCTVTCLYPMYCHLSVSHVLLPACIPCTVTCLYPMYCHLSVSHVLLPACIPCTVTCLYPMYCHLSVSHVLLPVCIPCTVTCLYPMYCHLSVSHVLLPACIPCTVTCLYPMYCCLLASICHTMRISNTHCLHTINPTSKLVQSTKFSELTSVSTAQCKARRSDRPTSLFL